MIKRKVSVILFIDPNGNILLQDRKSMSQHGEEYGFFGGKIEDGENPDQALVREIKEELGIKLTNFKFFKHHQKIIEEKNMDLEWFLYTAPMPGLNKINVQEGKTALMKFEDSFSLKMFPGEVELLKEIYDSVRK
ncbi:MAG: NUDIX domain-containing protein [Nanoarchaeota archaeon]|nr:NUDIX domain-containing protein [Nanoarchaeota archaeon]MBU1052028.1 NUDIX domain-containing protein [Nanoarchaeota archaeon]MBU1987885.1 NUDIX domain-containing protein [Nanoarchaeota archaeon]